MAVLLVPNCTQLSWDEEDHYTHVFSLSLISGLLVGRWREMDCLGEWLISCSSTVALTILWISFALKVVAVFVSLSPICLLEIQLFFSNCYVADFVIKCQS